MLRPRIWAILGVIVANVALAVPSAPALGDASGGISHVSRIQLSSPCVNQTDSGVDSVLGVLVIEESWYANTTVNSTACNEPISDAVTIRAFSLTTLKLLAQRIVNMPSSLAGGSYPLRKLSMDSVHHRAFIAFLANGPTLPNQVLAFSIPDIIHGHGRLNPSADLQVSSNPVQAGAASPTLLVSPHNPTGPPGDYELVPTAMTYDAPTDSLYMVMGQYAGGAQGSYTSAHGPGSFDVYLARISAATGQFAWLLPLDQCTYSMAFTTAANTTDLDDPLAVIHDGANTSILTGCIYTRTPSGIDGSQYNTYIQQSGSMLSYLVPLDGAAAPITGRVGSFLGRPNVLAGVADSESGRIFWPALPPSTQGTASAPAAVVFDARHQVYTGAPTIAGPSDLNGVFMTVVAGGRYYAASKAGIVVGDANATPPGQGILVTGYNCPSKDMVVDPRARRLFVRPVLDCNGAGFTGIAPYFDVFHDDFPTVSPPPEPAPDSYTSQVPEQPGVTVAQFNGHAAATGSRIRLVGGTSGLASGATLTGYDIVFGPNVLGGQGVTAPLDSVSREVGLGVVEGSNLDVYQASSNATAATADDATANQVAKNQVVSKWPFSQVHCSDPGSKEAGGQDSSDTGATVACDQAARTTSAESSAGPLGLTVKLAGQSSSVSLPISIGQSLVSTHVWIDPSQGMIAESHAIARGINTGVAAIDSVDSTMRCVAHGHTGTASCTYTRLISGVSSGGQPVGGGACSDTILPSGTISTCSELIAALNAIQPGQITFEMPDPDMSANSFHGSPGGYQAVGKRELYEHLQDDVLNYDSSQLVPGLEVTYVNDSAFQPSRINLQLAGTETETHYGIRIPASFDIGGGTGAFETHGEAVQPPLPQQAPVAAGNILQRIWKVIEHIVRRTVDGIAWAMRSPLTTAVVAILILVLLSPLGLAWRRRLLLQALSGG